MNSIIIYLVIFAVMGIVIYRDREKIKGFKIKKMWESMKGNSLGVYVIGFE